jgi:hypothetical protein
MHEIQSIVIKKLSHLGLGVGWIPKTHSQTQILRQLKVPTQNPTPIPILIPKYSKKPIPIPKTHTQILKKIKSLYWI